MSQYVKATNYNPTAVAMGATDTMDLFSWNGIILGIVASQVDWALVRKKQRPKGWFPKYDARYHALWLATTVGYSFAKGALGK